MYCESRIVVTLVGGALSRLSLSFMQYPGILSMYAVSVFTILSALYLMRSSYCACSGIKRFQPVKLTMSVRP